ncbi:MAG: hypothetical protein J5871_03840 [Bacteroidales bacterium]|nr:hypothetical protein [Bacteroidales bacterium]
MTTRWLPVLALAFVLSAGCDKSGPVPDANLPKADLLDIAFLPDGTAEDRSPKGMQVETVPGMRLTTYANARFGRQAAHFSNDLGSTTGNSYYKIDYSADDAFKDALADGHTWEAVVSIGENPAGMGEIKFFTATQSGGTGFLVSNAERGNRFSFIPNTGSWNWAESDTQPVAGQYYHLAGVFDNEKGVSQIYVNGVLQGSVENSSDTFKHASAGYQYIVIGGDPGSGGCTNAWNGDIVLARIYDQVLSAEDIAALAKSLPLPEQPETLPDIKNLQFLGDATVKAGWKYKLYGYGFQEGDAIRLTGAKATFSPATVYMEDHLRVTLPAGITEGRYGISLVRGREVWPLGSVNLTLTQAEAPAETRVIAHRGAYKTAGHPQNSIAALRATAPLEIYGAELDVWITRDDVVVVNHDEKFPGDDHAIQDASMADLAAVTLSNGEPVPTLESFITTARELGLRLVIEVKKQNACSDKTFTAAQNNERLVDACVALVKKHDYAAQCDWIGFDYESCKRIAAALPGSCVQYLNGDKTPAECHADGLRGIDYKEADLKPEWIREAHGLGMVVNVWTVDKTRNMLQWLGYGVDFITTNEPALCKALIGKAFIEK